MPEAEAIGIVDDWAAEAGDRSETTDFWVLRCQGFGVDQSDHPAAFAGLTNIEQHDSGVAGCGAWGDANEDSDLGAFAVVGGADYWLAAKSR